MSFLAPLYFAAAAAIALPIVLHFIRRAPHGRRAFSSLMFLSVSPPRLTRRSRLDNLLLLLLRAAALLLLAAAFSRPFIRQAARMPASEAPRRRVVILVDRSASMRRGLMWRKALDEVDRTLRAIEPIDGAAVLAFARDVDVLVEFDSPGLNEPATRASVAVRRLQAAGLSWEATDLGGALTTAAEMFRRDDGGEAASSQIVLITDLQQGADLSALEGAEWPIELSVDVRRIKPPPGGNAALHYLPPRNDAPADAPVRLRVVNSIDSATDRFKIRWANAPPAAAQEVYVPAGQSRVVTPPQRPRSQNVGQTAKLLLEGDAYDFDNTIYIAETPRDELVVRYVGPETPDDTNAPRYYLERALNGAGRRPLRVETVTSEQLVLTPPPDTLARSVPLVFFGEGLSTTAAEMLRDQLKLGGVALALLQQATASDNTMAQTIAIMAESPPLTLEAVDLNDSNDYAMLAEIDFTHPVLAIFNEPRFSDFTKIRYWRYVRVKPPSEARILARFDNDDAALWEQTVGRGKLLVLTSGWQPKESQLALSSKFVPLLLSIIAQYGPPAPASGVGVVGQPFALPALTAEQTITVTLPDRNVLRQKTGAAAFRQTSQVGFYLVEHAGGARRFAINIAQAESDTAPMDTDQLERFGVRLGQADSAAVSIQRQRQLRDKQLEQRQNGWRWLLLGAFGLLMVETVIAGRLSRPAPAASVE